MKRLLILPLLICSFLVTGCFDKSKANVTLRAPDGNIVQVLVEIADEPEEQSRGLMFRSSLDEDEGMIFLFEKPAPLAFWMKNTLIPLDVMFFDQQGQYLSSEKMVPCEADPCQIYKSAGPAAYVLEMASGFLEKHPVSAGWRLDLNQLPASLVPWNS